MTIGLPSKNTRGVNEEKVLLELTLFAKYMKDLKEEKWEDYHFLTIFFSGVGGDEELNLYYSEMKQKLLEFLGFEDDGGFWRQR